MIAVPAVWALTLFAIALCTDMAYITIVFLVLFIALWGAIKFIKVILTMVTGHEYDSF